MDKRARATALPTADSHDVSVAIQAHAFYAPVCSAIVGSKDVKNRVDTHAAIVSHGVGTQFAYAFFTHVTFRYIQDFLIRRQQYGTRRDRVKGDTFDAPGSAHGRPGMVTFEPKHGRMIQQREDLHTG